MEDPSNSISTQGISSAVTQMLTNNEATVIIDSYSILNRLAVQSGCCNWAFLKDRFHHNYWSFPLPKGSPFVPVFSNVWVHLTAWAYDVQRCWWRWICWIRSGNLSRFYCSINWIFSHTTSYDWPIIRYKLEKVLSITLYKAMCNFVQHHIRIITKIFKLHAYDILIPYGVVTCA